MSTGLATPSAAARVQPAAACPRCGAGFHCGVADATPCPCSAVTLDAGLLALLRQRFAGCLCGRCLAALAAGEPP